MAGEEGPDQDGPGNGMGNYQPEPPAHRIGDRPLWVGGWGAAKHPEDVPGVEFEHVVTLTERSFPTTTAHHPLEDFTVNDQAAFDAAVDAVRAADTAGEPALVHCAAGVCRSTTVTATAIAVAEGTDFATAIATVREHRGRATPDDLRVNADRYLDGL
jgi:hypothetical protein